MAGPAEQAQAGLDLALQLLHLWCAAGKAELALAWVSALIGDSSGMQRSPAAAESRMASGAQRKVWRADRERRTPCVLSRCPESRMPI